jgi:hypothetical protein
MHVAPHNCQLISIKMELQLEKWRTFDYLSGERVRLQPSGWEFKFQLDPVLLMLKSKLHWWLGLRLSHNIKIRKKEWKNVTK